MLSPKSAFVVLAACCVFPEVAGWSCFSRRKIFGGTLGTAALVGGAVAANAIITDKKDSTDLFTPSPGSLEGQTIVVTGGTTGLGLECVERLAVGGANIILTARSDSKGKAALEKVKSYLEDQNLGSNLAKISYKVVDLDDLDMVKAAAWKDVSNIDVLVNNAGVMAIPDRQLTMDGIERQMQSNHLGHFVLTSVLAPKLSENARIINVSSAAHQIAGGTGLLSGDELWKPSEADYGPWKSYGQSKLANLLFTQELQRRSDAAGKHWEVTSLHPGAVTTDLGRNMMGVEKYESFKQGKGSPLEMGMAKAMAAFLKTVPEGATTQIVLAARAEINEDVRGRYFIDSKARSLSAFATDEKAAKRLWEESEERAGVEFKL